MIMGGHNYLHSQVSEQYDTIARYLISLLYMRQCTASSLEDITSLIAILVIL